MYQCNDNINTNITAIDVALDGINAIDIAIDKINGIAIAINNDTSTWRKPYIIHPFMEMEAGTKRYTRLD